MKMYMAIDQYGHTYHGLKHPRKDLCERLCCSHVEKMYQDKKKHYHLCPKEIETEKVK